MVHRSRTDEQPVSWGGRPQCYRRLLTVLLALLCHTVVQGQVALVTEGDSVSNDREALFEVFREFRAGIMAGPQTRMQSARFSVKPGTDSCGIYDGASVTSASFTFLLDIIPESAPDVWIPFRLSRVDRSTTLHSGPRVQPARAPSGELIDVVTENLLEVRASGFTVALGAGWQIADGIRLGLCPTLTVQSADAVRNIETILSPPEARFPETEFGERPFRTGRDIQLRSVVAGVDALASARIEVGPFIAVHPELRLGVPLVDNTIDVPWSEVEFEARLGLSFDLASRALLTDTTSDSIAPLTTSPGLRAFIAAYGIDERGERYDDPVIEIEETPWSESVPLIPYIFFDSVDSELPSRYARFETLEESVTFSVDSLLAVTPVDIHWQMLNVVGQRLRERPTATVTVVGTVSGDESIEGGATLGRRRAQSVARYLVDVWQIAPERVATAFTATSPFASPEDSAEGRAENRRAEIRFSEPSVGAPVVIRRTATVASPPSVEFAPRIVADTTVAEWYVSIVQGPRELLRFQGDASTATMQQQKQWSLADLRVQRDLSPIRYRLTVRDVAGQRAVAEGAFRVVERPRRRQVDSAGVGFAVVEHSLVGFGYNSSDLLSEHLTRISEIAATLPPDAQVTVVGYTDRVGDPDRNQVLSIERANRVAEELRRSRARRGKPPLPPIATTGVGSQRELFDNRIPEGRLLSRMVRVTIVVPGVDR